MAPALDQDGTPGFGVKPFGQRVVAVKNTPLSVAPLNLALLSVARRNKQPPQQIERPVSVAWDRYRASAAFLRCSSVRGQIACLANRSCATLRREDIFFEGAATHTCSAPNSSTPSSRSPTHAPSVSTRCYVDGSTLTAARPCKKSLTSTKGLRSPPVLRHRHISSPLVPQSSPDRRETPARQDH